MENIKFRVFDKVNNEMCEWYELVNNPTLLRDCLSASDSTRVDIMQFTGLKDKHGKEIYEGDILKHEIIYKSDFGHPDKDVSNYYEVVFGVNILNIAGFYWKHKTRLLHGSPHDFEIIGNIHENPELLK